MHIDEQQVKTFLERRQLTVGGFSKAEMRAGKTPDFRVSRDGRLLFLCEVKSSPKDRWLDHRLEEAPPGRVVGGIRKDPIFNRLAGDVHDAVKQFDAVNQAQSHPEPPRDSRRLHFLRGWSNGKIKPIFSRSA
jgi:hypothetical protein